MDGRECDVDAICDGKDVLLPGIMEHIEHAGVPQVTQWQYIHHKHLLMTSKRRLWTLLGSGAYLIVLEL